MGTQLNLYSKKRSLEKINRQWHQTFPDERFIVYTRAIIESEIEYIRNDPSQSHLSYIKTVEDWNKAFTILAEGRGQISLHGSRLQDENDPYADELLKKVLFIAQHQKSFINMTGVNDMISNLVNCDHVGDKIKDEHLFGYTPLMCALVSWRSDESEITRLIREADDINQVNDFGDTALKIAVEFAGRNTKYIECIIDAGGDLFLKNNFKVSAYSLAKDCHESILSFVENKLLESAIKDGSPDFDHAVRF